MAFPSGHTFVSVVFYEMLAYRCYEKIRINFLKRLVIATLVLLTLVIGFSRIYLKLHYASDVIAGFSLGII
ncbi:MAG: phosphatase PAP2 family protein [Ferruginibacter sp.]|nr:phosphatase PAP2 family protein [Ferruginibacter sp.]